MNKESSLKRKRIILNSLFLSLNSYAFTLIELLVVIAIMGLIGTYVIANYRSFGEDQNLKNAVLDIQSLLRQAQTNATTNVVCNGIWQVNFSADNKTANLQCGTELATSTTTIKTLQIDKNDSNIAVQTVSGASCMSSVPFTISFTSLSGKVNFVSYPNCTKLTITLTNTKSTKLLIIEQGGRIYGQ